MYAVQNAPQPIQVASGWRPAAPNMGWKPAAPAHPRMGQGVSISEGAKVASAFLVGLAAGVSGGLLAFSANGDKPRPVLKGIGWAVLGIGFLTVVVNFFRVVGEPPATDSAASR